MKIAARTSNIFLLTFVSVVISIAQSTYESPYSRFGFGDLYNVSNAVNGSMGGLKYAVRSNNLVNPSNPASYSIFGNHRFVFDATLEGSMVRMSTEDKARDEGHFNLSSMSFGIPLGDKWGAAVGFLPYSTVGYSIQDPGFHQKFGGYNTTFDGSGGMSRVFAGVAYDFAPGFSVGVNANYLFGSLNYNQIVTFDSIHFLNIRSQKTRVVNDFTFDVGIQYRHDIDEDKETYLLSGLSVAIPANLTGYEDVLTETFRYSGVGTVIVSDTVSFLQSEKGKVKLPLAISAGVNYGRSDRWMLGADVSVQDWSSFEAFGIKDSLSQSFQIAVGGQYRVNNVLLRGGARFNQTYLQIKDNQLNEYGISFGFGVPVYNAAYSVSLLSFGVEIGRRGTSNHGLIKENFAKVWLSFTMNQERWFQRRQYR